uniref:CHCH domain-containing protein n=1 Tax=Tetranychus urticae TaxID=32264 RepID=T1KXA3_TETUR
MSVPFGSGRAIPKAPDKGSFPLDHDKVCHKSLIAYLKCLRKKDSVTLECRDEIKSYLQCRMENGLMSPEDWQKLGFTEKDGHQQSITPGSTKN